MEPIVVYAPEGSFWRRQKAAWLWGVIVRDETGQLISDAETAFRLFGAEYVPEWDQLWRKQMSDNWDGDASTLFELGSEQAAVALTMEQARELIEVIDVMKGFDDLSVALTQAQDEARTSETPKFIILRVG